MPSIDDFKAQLSRRNGLAMANRYRAVISLPPSISGRFPETAALDLLCDATGLPGRQITTIDYQAHKQVIKVPYGFMNEDVTFTFLLTGDYHAKKVFDAWAESIIDFSNYRAKYLDQHVSTIQIYQTSNNASSVSQGNDTRTVSAGTATNDTRGLDNQGVSVLPPFVVAGETVTEPKIYGVRLMNAYPVTISGVNLDNAAENTIQKLSVVMTYENFEVLERYRT
jgi:hypothetical protein